MGFLNIFLVVFVLCLVLGVADSSGTSKGGIPAAKRRKITSRPSFSQCWSLCRKANADRLKVAVWNYVAGDVGGPEHWRENYPNCGGMMQSPINIDTSRVVYDRTLDLFDFSDYSITDGVTMQLTNLGGHTAELILSGKKLFLRNGNLPDTYVLEQMHFHWGYNDNRGSEHSVDGKFFPLEIHIVHRQNHFPTVDEASKSAFGLAVISIFVTAGQENTKFNQLIDFLDKIPNPNNDVEVPAFPLSDLIPERYDFYRYYGSLTTPPCYESVIWSIGTDPIQLSEQQLNKFRALYNEKHKFLVDDYRPLQPLNKRTVTTTKAPRRE